MVKGRIEIRSESCKACGYCIKFCPKNVLDFGKDVNPQGYRYITMVRPENCIGCATCALMCPDAAIEVYREEA